MTKLLLILIFLIVFLLLLILIFFLLNKKQRFIKKAKIFLPYITFFKEEKLNPDISTDNWDLHKLRLNKFGRSQYKGLTFFLNSENKIYYLSEEGDRVYC